MKINPKKVVTRLMDEKTKARLTQTIALIKKRHAFVQPEEDLLQAAFDSAFISGALTMAKFISLMVDGKMTQDDINNMIYEKEETA